MRINLKVSEKREGQVVDGEDVKGNGSFTLVLDGIDGNEARLVQANLTAEEIAEFEIGDEVTVDLAVA